MRLDFQFSGLQILSVILGLALLTIIIIVVIRLFIKYKTNSLKYKPTFSDKSIRERVKYRYADDFSYSSILLKFGFLISISFVLVAFNWAIDEVTADSKIDTAYTIEPLEMIPRTNYNSLKSILPPPTPDLIVEIPNEVKVDQKEFVEEIITKETATNKPSSLIKKDIIVPPAPDPIILKRADDNKRIFKIVEQMPRFPGCEDLNGKISDKKSCADDKMLAYLYDNIRYPKLAIENNIEGTAVISFTVEKDGSIDNFEILRDPGGGLGSEALRVVKSMNNLSEKWTAGRQRNIPVKVRYTIPIKFAIGK